MKAISLTSLAFILIGFLVFTFGFHNIDIAYNCLHYDLKIDTSTSGIIRSCQEVHLLGLNGLIIGIILIMVGVLFWYIILLSNISSKKV